MKIVYTENDLTPAGKKVSYEELDGYLHFQSRAGVSSSFLFEVARLVIFISPTFKIFVLKDNTGNTGLFDLSDYPDAYVNFMTMLGQE